MNNELVRHFLIESSPKGVKLKGCPNEPYFGKRKLPPMHRQRKCLVSELICLRLSLQAACLLWFTNMQSPHWPYPANYSSLQQVC